MKSPDDVLNEVGRRLGRTWSHVVTGTAWEQEFRLGTSGLTGHRLADAWPEVLRAALRWQEWLAASGAGVELKTRAATVHRARQTLPASLVVATIDDAARLVGADWPARLARGRARRAVLAAEFPELPDPAAALRAADALSDVDFELASRAARWFTEHPGHGLTARQVPVEGMGTKWLASHLGFVRRLAGLEDLGLETGRPPRVHLTYLDPDHVAAGGRHHDIATVGDVDTVAYRPQVVLISENRDTAQLFPAVAGGIAIEGEGRGAAAVASLSWVRQAATLVYWGDIDADGLEILHGFRAAGLPVQSLFMDLAAYERWERYGVDHDHAGKPLGPREPRDVSRLEPEERDLYLALCSREWSRHRRIEQERIPLGEAVAAVTGA